VHKGGIGEESIRVHKRGVHKEEYVEMKEHSRFGGDVWRKNYLKADTSRWAIRDIRPTFFRQ
jgi:hypothetical protein